MDPQRTSSTTHLDVTPEGVAVHERRWPPGSSPDPAVALAARLREAAHPGVVELIDLELDPPVVRTRFVSGTTAHDLADADDPSTVASLLTALASTLADLHGRGVVHGRLTPDHVVVTPDGAPVLVGWRPHDADDPPPLPTDDVAAFGELVRTLAGSGLDETSDELRAVASRARAADPAARPSMRALADSLADVANRPPPPTVGRMILPRIAPLGHDRRHLSRRRVATAAAVVAVALGATGLGVILHRITAPTPRPRSIALSPTTESRPATTTTTSVRVSTTTDPPCDTTAEVPSQPGTRSLVDADGDGCPEWVHVDGQRIAVGDDIWSVGEPGDLVAVGDWSWDCDGRAGTVVLRPSTGELWVTTTLPELADQSATAIGAVVGAVGVSSAPTTGRDCVDLVVTRADGTAARVDLSAVATPPRSPATAPGG